MVEQNELKSDDFFEKRKIEYEEFVRAAVNKERFLSDKGNYRFIFMTSRTSYFKR